MFMVPMQFYSFMTSLGMVSYKMSLITTFGQKHFEQKFIANLIIFNIGLFVHAYLKSKYKYFEAKVINFEQNVRYNHRTSVVRATESSFKRSPVSA